LLVGFSLFWFSDTIADPDLWGHIRFGQEILRTGSIVRADIYSYRTGGQPWINHEWLCEVIFAGLYNLSGPAGLIVFKVLVSLLILGLSHAHLRRRGLGPYSSVFLLVLMSIPFRLGLGTIRPQIFTYLNFFFELLLLEKAIAGREYWLWLLPILLAVWVNLHGGVLAGAVVLGIWIAVQLVVRPTVDPSRLDRSRGASILIGLVGFACGLALLLNPYGAELVVFLLRTATMPRPEISEWTPLGLMSLPGQLYLALLVIGTSGLVWSRRRREPTAILIFSVAALLPLISNRHYPLFALTLVVLGGEHIADVWNRWCRPTRFRFAQGRGIAAISVLVSLVLTGLALPGFGCIRIEPFYFAFPARAVALLKQSGVRGNMAVSFDWGEYVLWYLGPGIQVSIDGRRETVYSDESYRQSLDFARGTGDWDALLRTAPTDLVLVPMGSPTANLLSRTAKWVPLYKDSYCVLFVREGFPGLGEILQSPIPSLSDNGAGLCFPAPDRSHRRVIGEEIRLTFLNRLAPR
jgi:hypothetical protein